VNGLDALLQSLDGECDVVDACALYQLSVVSVQVLTKLLTVDEYSQFFCVGDEFLWIQHRPFWHTAVNSVRSRLLCVVEKAFLGSITQVLTKPG